MNSIVVRLQVRNIFPVWRNQIGCINRHIEKIFYGYLFAFLFHGTGSYGSDKKTGNINFISRHTIEN
jgi:hypothetical protein